MSSQHVLIVGAGICGLAIAHGLQKAGIPFTIFEAEDGSTFRPREWTMALHWSIPMLESLLPDDLAARLKTDAVVDPSLDYTKYPNSIVPVFDGVTGEMVREIPNDGLRVSRRKLRALCHERIDVQYGHTLQTIGYDDMAGTVTATFANGARHTGTLLVGADGTRSAVRGHLCASAATTPLGLVYTNLTIRYPDADRARFARSANPVTSLVVHPDCSAFISMQDVPDPAAPETWTFQLITMWSGSRDPKSTNQERHAELREKTRHLNEPFRSAFGWISEEVPIQNNELGFWDPSTHQPWDTHGGRVTLAGDAAHSMPPHRGQGLNNALNDAYNLVAAVRTMNAENRVELVQAYSDEVAERGGKEVRLSRETAGLMLNYTDFRKSALITQGLKKSSS